MDHHLSLWLDNAYSIINADRNSESSLLITSEEKILIIGRQLFSLPEQATIGNIVTEINMQFQCHRDISSCSYNLVAELLLTYAVSEYCNQSAEFVEGIMNMDSEAQVCLMGVIQDSLAELEQSKSISLSENENNNVRISSSDRRKSIICIECSEKDKLVESLKDELSDTRLHHDELISKLKEAMSLETSKVVDAELIVLERENTIVQRDNSINEANKKIQDLELSIRDYALLEDKLETLQDEIDVLRPKADKLDAAENQLNRLREKVEELSNVKQQLKTEGSKHSEALTKITELQQELDGLRKLKPQVDTYRSQCAESQIIIDELKIKMDSLEIKNKELQKENDCMKDGNDKHLLQSKRLAEELHEASEHLREVVRVGGIGEAMTELNPGVMHELQQLRIENKKLSDQLDSTTLESVEQMKESLEDAKLMISSLQKKWSISKDALEEANQLIETRNKELHHLKFELETLNNNYVEMGRASSERLTNNTAEYENKIQSIISENEVGLQIIIQSHNEKVATMHVEYDSKLIEIEEKYNKLSGLNAELSIAHERLEDTHRLQLVENEKLSNDCKMMKSQIDVQQESFEKELKSIKTSVETDKELLQIQANESIKQLKEKCRLDVAEEKKIATSIRFELEIEGSNLKKSERIRKFLEAEVQRQKGQIQMAGCSSNGTSSHSDIEQALKELKAMQLQLDDLIAENTLLKATLVQGKTQEQQINHNTSVIDENNQFHSPEFQSESNTEKGNKSGKVLKGPMRAVRNNHTNKFDGVNADQSKATGSFPMYNNGTNHHNQQLQSTSYSGILEQSEMNDKKIDVLQREKREFVLKLLEETKEKNELSQKLLMNEKEIQSLRSELRKITLEKERAERKAIKFVESSTKENHVNNKGVGDTSTLIISRSLI
eukprot:gene6539-8985_t